MDNQQLMNEMWEDIVGFEGYYQISSFGRVKGLERFVNSARSSSGKRKVSEKLIRTRIDRYGYDTVILRKDNKNTHFTIHRLVANAFLKNPNNYPCVNHKDENKLNNYYENLEWCTVDYNNKYNGRQDKIHKILRTRDFGNPQIMQINLLNNQTTIYTSIHDACRKTGFSRQEISKCCRNLRGPYHNSTWHFIK